LCASCAVFRAEPDFEGPGIGFRALLRFLSVAMLAQALFCLAVFVACRFGAPLRTMDSELELPTDDEGMSVGDLCAASFRIPRPQPRGLDQAPKCCNDKCLDTIPNLAGYIVHKQWLEDFKNKSHEEQDLDLFHMLRDMRKAQQASDKCQVVYGQTRNHPGSEFVRREGPRLKWGEMARKKRSDRRQVTH